MARKKPGTVPNRHIYTRISFLYQASTYLAQTDKQVTNMVSHRNATAASADADAEVMHDVGRMQDQAISPQDDKPITTGQNMSRKLLNDVRVIAQKSLIRVSPHVKRSICKYCDSLLVEGETSSSAVENNSKGGRKPWADVLVIKCHTCGGKKRFPTNAREQKRRPLRNVKSPTTTEQEVAMSAESQIT